MPKFPKNKGYKSPVKHFGGSHKDNPEAVVSPGDPKVFAKWGRHSHAASEGKPSKRVKSATEYAPFKMKHAGSNPMKANFKSAFKQVDDIKNPVAGASPMKGHMHTDNLPDGRSRSAAFQLHDGKKFEDAGFMDTHFPSGKARTPAKQLDDKEKGKKIVRRMKQIEAKLAKNGNLSEEKKKKLKDELLKLSTTIRGQEYTDTGK